MASKETGSQSVIKNGYFLKQGVNGRTWKRRYFVLTESSLTYYKDEGGKQKGKVKLVVGRGVRNQAKCKVEWPRDASEDLCFGIATESRTYYLYTTEIDAAGVREWMEAIQQVIEQMGKPTNDWRNDPEGKPEGHASKAVRGTIKVTAKLTKLVSHTGLLPGVASDIARHAADFAEKQADADPRASMWERAKLAAISGAGVVGGEGIVGAALDATSQFVPMGIDAVATAAAVTGAVGKAAEFRYKK